MSAMPSQWDDEFKGGDTVAKLRVPPHSIVAESGVLGGLLLDNGAWDRIGDLLRDADFYRHEHRLVFAAICALVNACKPADVFTVHEALKSQGKAEEVGGLAYLNSLAQYVPSARNIRSYAETVRENSIRRQLITKADEIASKAFAGQTGAVDLLDEAERELGAIAEAQGVGADGWVDADTGMVALLDHIQTASEPGWLPDFTPTGIPELDEKLDGGLRGGELYIFGGRPGMGKSQLAQTIADYVAIEENKPVATFSMEMPATQHYQRLAARQGRIHLSSLRRPQRLNDRDWKGVTTAVERSRGARMSVYDRPGLNINQIRTLSRGAKRRFGGELGLIVVDYLQLMSGTDARISRTYQLEEASRGLKSLAKELNVPVIALVQVGRGVEKESDPMPRMSDIRDCGSIEQDADVIGFIHRPIVFDKSLKEDVTSVALLDGQSVIAQGELWKLYARFGFVKMRAGDPGEIAMQCEGHYQTFASWNPLYPTPRSVSERARAGNRGGTGL